MGLTCPEVQDKLSAWLDGELPPELLALVDRHLDGCAACRRQLAQLEVLDQALLGLSAPPVPDLTAKVKVRLRRPGRRGWQSLALVASLVIGILLGGTLARDFYPLAPVAQQENGISTEVASLEEFHDFPQGSLGMILASYQVDEGNGNSK